MSGLSSEERRRLRLCRGAIVVAPALAAVSALGLLVAERYAFPVGTLWSVWAALSIFVGNALLGGLAAAGAVFIWHPALGRRRIDSLVSFGIALLVYVWALAGLVAAAKRLGLPI